MKKFAQKISAIALALLPVLAYADLPISIGNRLTQAGVPSENASFLAVSLDDGTTVVNHLADTPRVPASTQKLITTAAALDSLGADFVWRNDIYHTGVLANGVLYGDVVMVGSGDPSMDYQRLDALMGELAKKVKHIKGDIYIDDSRFENVYYDPYAFDGEGLRAYNAPPSAFLVNFGTVEVRFVPSGYTDELGNFVANPNANNASVQLFPKLDGVALPTAIATKKGCELPKVKLGTSLQLGGAFGADCGVQSLWQTVGDNQKLARLAVLGAWRQHDRAFGGKVVVGKPSASHQPPHILPLVSGLSKPVAEQIWQINHFSNNVMTEQTALSLPLYADGRAVSGYPLAFEFLGKWWHKRIGKNPPIITRASGLCTDCLVRPSAMVNLLKFMYQHKDFETYKTSLPLAGVDGTMKNLAKRSATNTAIGRAWIKTGRLNDVNAMTGYIQATSGKWYAVVGVINSPMAGSNAKATAVLDDFLDYVAKN